MCSSNCELSDDELETVSALSLVIDIKNNEIKRRSSGFKGNKTEKRQPENKEESENLIKKCKGIESIADKLKNKNENNNSQVEVKNAKIKSTRTLNKNYNVKTEGQQSSLEDSIDSVDTKTSKHQKSREIEVSNSEFTENNFKKSRCLINENSFFSKNNKRDLKEKNPTTGFEIFSKKPRVQASKSSETLDQNYANDHSINNLSSKDNFKNSLSSEQPKSKKGDVKQSSMRMMELRPMPKSFMPYNRENIEKVNYCCSSSDSYSSQCYNRQPSLKIKPQRPSPVRSPGLNSHKVNTQLQQHLTRKQQTMFRNEYKQTCLLQNQDSLNSSKSSEENSLYVKEHKVTETFSKSERKIDTQYLKKAAEKMGEWDIDCVCKFLDHINCGQHKDIFRENYISGDTLPFLKVELLVDLGLPFGIAYKVIARIHRLLGTYPNILLAYHNAL